MTKRLSMNKEKKIMNKFVKKSIGKDAVYKVRLLTDEFYLSPIGSFDYVGEYDKANRFVEEHQLLNARLWETFVEMFRIRPDDPDKGWRGEYWGKMMRGACWTYRYTQNPELYETLKKAVLDLLATADDDGRISSYTRSGEFDGWDMWSRKYVLLGLQYFMEICPSARLKSKIVKAMKKHCDYIIANVGEGKRNILQTSTHWGGLNSCSILEPVVRLYSITGDKKYLNFAKYIVGTGGSSDDNILELAYKNEKKPYEYKVTKAYEMMSFFEGVLELYRITGEQKLRTAFFNFLDAVIETDYTIIGCSGCTHELFDNSKVMQTEASKIIMQETCVTVTFMKTCFQALCMTGEAKYADCIERSGYNAMLGSINFNKNTHIGLDKEDSEEVLYRKTDEFVKSIGGLTFDSYAPLYKQRRNRKTGGFKIMPGNRSYGCCACIGSAGTALMVNYSVMATKTGFALNTFMEGHFIGLTPKGRKIAISLKTAYPYDGKVEIEVATVKAEKFTLAVRIPSFVSEMEIDGETVLVTPDSYYEFEREWSGIDKITLVMPIKMKAVELNGKIALERGNIVYALDSRNQDINAKVGSAVLSDEAIEKDFDCRSARKVTFDNGVTVKATDFASASADWDREDCYMTVWIDKE